MPTFYGAIDLSKNELRNAVVQNLPSAPATPTQGQIYFDSTGKILYWYNGTAWVAAQSGGSLSPASTVTTQAVADAPVVGASTNYAREDHKHGREAFGTVTAQTAFGAASGNGSAVTVTRSDHTHGTPTHAFADHSTYRLDQWAVPTVAVSMNNQLLTNVATPVSVADAANKNYVDNAVAGLAWKDSVKAATTAAITLSPATSVIDGVTMTANDRLLIKNQGSAVSNGIYYLNGTDWSRANDANIASEVNGAAVFVEQGTINADTAWVMTSNVVTVDTDVQTWVQFAGGGTVTAGAGMTQAGNVLNVIAGDTSLTVAADSVIVNTAVIADKTYVNNQLIGKASKAAGVLTGTSSPEVITHGLNTQYVVLTVYNGVSPYTVVEVDWDSTSVNTATIRYNPNLGAGYRWTALG